MKILFIANNLDEQCGWGRYAWEVVSRMSEIHTVTVLVEEPSGKKIEQPVLGRSKNIFHLFRNVIKVRGMAKHFDMIHAMDAWPYASIAWLGSMGKPYFVNVIGSYSVAPLEHFGKSWLLKKSLKSAKKVFCISKFVRDEVFSRAKSDNLEVVHLGVDMSKFVYKNKIRDKRLIVSIGAVKRRKGYDVAIRAFADLKKKFPDLRYKIIGRKDQGGYADSLKQYVQDNKLSDSVEFIENISDVEMVDILNSAGLFMLLPVNYKNHFEGFGLVFLEAAACGLPVIGTFGNGDEDAIINGKNGFLVQQENPQAAVEAATKIIEDSRLWDNFSQASLEFARAFTWNKTVSRYLEFYANIKH